jgi:uroporphyrinogen decarboxylase
MNNKERLEMILRGEIPDAPPHFELVFQIEKEYFGMNPPHPEDRKGNLQYNLELQTKLVDEFDYAAVYPVASDPESIGLLKKELGTRALIAPHDWDGVFWMPSGDTLMDFVVRLYEKADELHKEARIKCDEAKIRLKKLADAGADLFILAHDFGFNEGPFVSPEQFGEFIAPYFTEIVDYIHRDLKLKAILHSDGDLRLILDQIYQTGIDGYQSVDPQGHMDIKKVREQYPEWILMGNVKSSMLQDTVEKDIRESVRYCMKYGGMGKPYIFSTSNCIFEGMPNKSYDIMLDEYNKIISSGDEL